MRVVVVMAIQEIMFTVQSNSLYITDQMVFLPLHIMESILKEVVRLNYLWEVTQMFKVKFWLIKAVKCLIMEQVEVFG